ncbi:MAG: hypothetical protein AAF585_19605 [Verrucomicrobiota bacterium]
MGDDEESWGLHAYARTDLVEISLHERIDGQAWELEFVWDQTTLAFESSDPNAASALLAFLRENYGKTNARRALANEYSGVPEGTLLFSQVAQLRIESTHGTEISISKCGELPDRFGFALLPKGSRFHMDLHDPKTTALIEALAELIPDIEA